MDEVELRKFAIFARIDLSNQNPGSLSKFVSPRPLT